MSGDRVVLAGDVDGAAERLVRTVAQLADLDLGRYALVGGLAVMCRLSAVHRATQDVDTVTETGAPSALEAIASNIGTLDATNPNRVVVDGVKIDVIATDSFEQDDLHDLYRLVLDHDRSGALTDALAAAPYGLGVLVGDALRSGVTDEPERAARLIRTGGPETQSAGPEALIDVLGPLVAQLGT